MPDLLDQCTLRLEKFSANSVARRQCEGVASRHDSMGTEAEHEQ